MSDLENAKNLLKNEGYTCVLCKGAQLYASRSTGISPMLDFLEENTDLNGFSAADKIVGKAAAMLFALAGVTELYAEVLSRNAVSVLETYGIRYSYGILTERIINRRGDGICPMEETVAETTNLQEAFYALLQKRKQLKKGDIV